MSVADIGDNASMASMAKPENAVVGHDGVNFGAAASPLQGAAIGREDALAGASYTVWYEHAVAEKYGNYSRRDVTFRLMYSHRDGFASNPTNRDGIAIIAHRIGTNMIHIPSLSVYDTPPHAVTVLYNDERVPVGVIITGATDARLVNITRI